MAQISIPLLHWAIKNNMDPHQPASLPDNTRHQSSPGITLPKLVCCLHLCHIWKPCPVRLSGSIECVIHKWGVGIQLPSSPLIIFVFISKSFANEQTLYRICPRNVSVIGFSPLVLVPHCLAYNSFSGL